MEINPEMMAAIPKALRIEIEENVNRKDFTDSELAQIQQEVIACWAKEAKERELAGVAPVRPRDVRVDKPKRRANTTEKVASLFGEKESTVRKRLAIVAAAEAEPERFGKLLDDMDRTGRVDGPFKRLKVARQAEQIKAEPPGLPGRGPYRVIVADPPWPYELRKIDPSHRATHPYPQMSIAQICAERVATIAHADCVLWLWTTNHHMREAFAVLDAWGFAHKTILTWAKDRMGTGDWLRGQTEHCLMSVRGSPTVTLTNQTTLLHGPLRANSQKPDEFFPFVEKLCPAPRYAYLFARASVGSKWDCHGDEVNEAADAGDAA